jgi:hypothetical protein
VSSNQLPNAFSDKNNQVGNIFSLFLTNPLFGFCYICSIEQLNADLLNRAHGQLKTIFIEIGKALFSSKKIGNIFNELIK